MTQRKTKALWAVLAVLCGLVMLRTAFTGLEIDEEYALSLGYRLVSGDRLFATMWEPHQLSALPAAALLAVYLGVTGTTTGVLLFFRLVVLACKAAMSWVFYREFRRDLGRGGAALAALVLFLYIPKWFLGPDYTGQQFHFTVAAFLCFHHYVTRGFRRPWLVVLGAVCACFGFLAFPQSIAAFPFLWVGLVVLGRRGGEKRFFGIPRGAWLLLGSCAVCGGAFLIWALQGMGFDLGAFLERVGLILHDPQYSFTAAERLALLAQQALPVVRSLLWPLLGAAVLCAVVRWRRGALPGGVSLLLGSWGALAALQCTARAVLDGSLDERQFVPVLVLFTFMAGCSSAIVRACVMLVLSMLGTVLKRDYDPLAGLAMALLLLQQNCTVTIAHSRTQDLASVTRQADILVVAVGRPGMITGDMIKPGAVVLDVGINRVDGKVVGDVDFDSAASVASRITPVPGGVGAMTIAMLMENAVEAAEHAAD